MRYTKVKKKFVLLSVTDGALKRRVLPTCSITSRVATTSSTTTATTAATATATTTAKGESAETLQRTKRLHVQLALLGGCSMRATRCHRRKAVRSLRHSWVFSTVD